MRLGCSRSVFRVAAKPPSGRLKPRSDTSTSDQLLESISLNFRHGLERGFEEMRTPEACHQTHFLEVDSWPVSLGSYPREGIINGLRPTFSRPNSGPIVLGSFVGYARRNQRGIPGFVPGHATSPRTLSWLLNADALRTTAVAWMPRRRDRRCCRPFLGREQH